MNRKTKTAVLVVGAFAAMMGVQRAEAEAKTYTIALVPGIATDPFYITMQRGAAAEAKKLGVHLIWQGGASFSPETQIPILQALLAKHPDALVIAPTNKTALINPIKQYVAAKIPTISVDTTITDDSLLKARITSNNTQGGAAAADAIAKSADEKGDVAIINVKPGISTTDARQKGFLSEMKKYPHMKVIATEYDDDSPTKAFADTQLLLLKYPHLVGVFGTNVFSAQGAGKAVETSGRKGKVNVVGYDAEPGEVKLLKQGVITTLIVQQPAKEGALGVKYAYDILTGHAGKVPKSRLLTNVTATTQNANDPNIAKYFYKSNLAQ
ncbi:MAG: LacI family transcriptional regulator [Acidiphilium sp. 37-64-53]|uniref:ABC transporter substrate-binding protein n=2 Tax=Acidocellaceae TaxID=3385905 RepID=UPI000BDD7A24|nr:MULTISPECIES: ABC transporter substrate-binding protein [Acidiphilium]OYW00192.1 MAG: LacI family transcriptional regulator [Acidiphilium sp. 37-64-53]OZB28205.1 MAG: LacI family transcriptional regulator [Acidiphilium sp. 34-64-41]